MLSIASGAHKEDEDGPASRDSKVGQLAHGLIKAAVSLYR